MRRPFAAAVLALSLAGSLLPTVTSSAATRDPGAPGTPASRQAAETAADRALARAAEALQGAPADPTESVTLALRDLSLVLPDLDPTERERARALLARPTQGTNDPYGDGYTVPAKRTCSRKICVHWVSRTSDAPPSRSWVDRNLAVMRKTWAHEVGKLGYRRPVRDGDRGGDSRFDVYLKDVGEQGYYGYCAKERPKPGTRWMASGYCVLDNDFSRAQYGTRPVASLRVTAAHEFFHAIQYAYDYAEDGWLMEATATWMEERVADGINDNRQYLRYGQVAEPGEPLDLFDRDEFDQYGNWAFFEYLSSRFGTGIVRRIWGNADGNYRNHSVAAVKRSLPRNRSFLGTFRAYAAANTVPGTSYPEGESWPSAPMATDRTLTPGSPSASGELRLDHLAAGHLSLRPADDLAAESWRVRVRVDGPRRSTSPTAYVIVHETTGDLARRTIRLDRDGNGRRTFRFGTTSVDRLTVTLANASTRYRCWQERFTYACRGVPRDDDKRFSWSATAFRR